MDFKEIKQTKHYIYDNLDEFNIHHQNVPVRHNWRHGNENEWVFTDDGYVCQILRKLDVLDKHKKKATCVRTLCGTFIAENMAREMLGDEGIAEDIYTFSGEYKSAKDNKKRKLTSRELIFARYVATGMDIIKAYKLAFPDSKSSRYIKKRAERLHKTETINKMISKEKRKLLEDEGVTDNWIIELYKTVADLADNDTHKLKALDSLAKMSGLFDNDEKKSEQVTIWAGFSPEQLEEVKKHGKPQIIAHAETTKEDEKEENS